MNDLNDPIFKQLAETYRQINELYHGNVSDCMKQCKEVHPHLSTEECKKQYCEESMTTQGRIHESHTHEELMKLSDEKLKDLVAEYTKKAAESKGEEKEHHEKELADIKSIMASRKDDKKEKVEEGKIQMTKKKLGESAKDIIQSVKALTEKVAYKKRLAEESNEDHIAHHLSNAQNHWDHMEKGYTSDAVPHMKKAKAMLHKATPEEQKRYKFIMDRLDKPHREDIGEEYSQEKLADKVVSNAEKIKKLEKQKIPTHNVKRGK